MNDPTMVAATIPFTDRELRLVSERAAAHGMSFVDFVRACALTQPTWLEVPPGPSSFGQSPTASSAGDRSNDVPL